MSPDLNNRGTPSAIAGAGPAVACAGVHPESGNNEAPEAGWPCLLADDVERIIQSRHDMPFRILGPHSAEGGHGTVVRAFLPNAERVVLRILGENAGEQEMRRLHPDGLFQAWMAQSCDEYQFLIIHAGGERQRISDPYRFRVFHFTAEDARLFTEGNHLRLFEKLGARRAVRGGVAGVDFAVWAPNAARVSVVGIFNEWDGRRHPMQRTAECGVWELFVPGVGSGALYKYEIKTPAGAVFVKSDPFAVHSEASPGRASIVDDLRRHVWRDAEWMREGRLASVRDRGVRAFAWRARTPDEEGAGATGMDGLFRSFVADGYTHVELSVPEDGRAGASLFEFGPPFSLPDDLMAWVNACHRHGLGVVLRDHGAMFPAALSHLTWFDGTQLYERPGAGTPVFDVAKGEVRSILLSAAAFWLDRYHIDVISSNSAGAALLGELLRDGRDRFPGFRLLVRDEPAEATLSAEETARIVTGRHDDPFAVLGLQRTAVPPTAPDEARTATRAEAETVLVIRAMQPAAVAAQVLPTDRSELVYAMQMIDDAGLFEVRLPEVPADYRLRVFERGGASRELVDPYGFREFSFGAEDQHLFGAGNHYNIYRKLGAHPRTVNGAAGVGLAVWAPNAEGVGVVGPFNGWNGLVHQMKRLGVSGVWETFVPGLAEGDLYKFEIRSPNGHVFLKTDPYASYAEVPPATASVVCELRGAHAWRDRDWMEKRRAGNPWRQPIAVYEVHLGSWMRDRDNRPLTYRELAAKLVPYVKGLGFTHIELLPIAEHPYEPSWGYQVSNFYAPTSRFGAPADLMEFVDQCHEAGIGVILDWVPGHFPKDAHALAWFDGTHLYEHDDPRKGEHPDWGTLIFNYGRHEVENFLIANALFWLEVYHFDGLRVDAVASMLYLDYSRPKYGGWIPNVHGGNENLEAIEFLKHTNSVLHARFPGVLMIAEESTSWPKVSRPTDQGGLGFGFKWNMGWMHDTLAYFSVPPSRRKEHHGRLTFSIMYAFSENFILSLSHDEVVHLKRSLLNKMPGEAWEKFANLRLLFALMYAHPGKKLLFMGAELGQEGEWSHAQALQWDSLKQKANRSLGWFIQDLNCLYRAEGALHEADFTAAGFEWLEVDNADESVIAFLRKGRDPRDSVLFAANFSDISRPKHRIGVPYPVTYTELFDTAAKRYGGFGGPSSSPRVLHAEEIACHGRDFSICLTLPALSAVILKPAPPPAN